MTLTRVPGALPVPPAAAVHRRPPAAMDRAAA